MCYVVFCIHQHQQAIITSVRFGEATKKKKKKERKKERRFTRERATFLSYHWISPAAYVVAAKLYNDAGYNCSGLLFRYDLSLLLLLSSSSSSRTRGEQSMHVDARDVTNDDDVKWFRVGDLKKEANLVLWIIEYCRSACHQSLCHVRLAFGLEFTCFGLSPSLRRRRGFDMQREGLMEQLENRERERRGKSRRRKRRKLVVLVFRM